MFPPPPQCSVPARYARLHYALGGGGKETKPTTNILLKVPNLFQDLTPSVQPLLPQRWVPGQSPPRHIRHIPPRAFQGHAYPIAPAVVQVTRDRQGVSGSDRPRQRRRIETLPPIRKDHPRHGGKTTVSPPFAWSHDFVFIRLCPLCGTPHKGQRHWYKRQSQRAQPSISIRILAPLVRFVQ